MCDYDPGAGGIRGGTSHSPVNPMHFRNGIPSFSLEGSNGWWERQAYDRSESPVNPMRFRDCTPCFSMKRQLLVGHGREENWLDREDS